MNRRRTLGSLERKADKVFSEWIRKRDGNRCITPGPECSSTIQAGHFIKRGKRAVRYDGANVHAQCSSHNVRHNYYPELMTLAVLDKLGIEEFNALILRSRKVHKTTREELEAVIEKCSQPKQGELK